MSDGGKGSGRRKEDASKVRDNWDLIFGAKAPVSSPTAAGQSLKEQVMEFNDDGDTICPQCGTEMSATEHGRWLYCDICGHTEDFEDSYDGWDESYD